MVISIRKSVGIYWLVAAVRSDPRWAL